MVKKVGQDVGLHLDAAHQRIAPAVDAVKGGGKKIFPKLWTHNAGPATDDNHFVPQKGRINAIDHIAHAATPEGRHRTLLLRVRGRTGVIDPAWFEALGFIQLGSQRHSGLPGNGSLIAGACGEFAHGV